MKNLSKKSVVLIMIGVMAGMLLASVDATIVATAMPKIVNSLNGFNYYAWPMTAYLLCMTVSIPLFGKLADTYGFKPIYIIGITVFLLGSASCGLAQTMIELIIFRGFQGIGGGILVTNSLAIIGVLFAPADRAKYLGIAGSISAIASVVGPSLGGYITDNFSWRWVFYVNVPIGIIALITILLVLPTFVDEAEHKTVDYFGALALILAIVPLLLAFTWAGNKYAWNTIQIISMFVFAVIMLIVFGVIETKADDPIVPMSLFKKSIFNFSAVEMFLLSAIMIGAAIFIPLFVQGVIGSSASKSGEIITPMMLSLVAGSIISGLTVSKTCKYKVLSIIGFMITIAGTVMLTFLGIKTSNSYVVFNMILLGFGMGTLLPIFNVTAQNAFPESQMGTVTSAIQFSGKMGQTIASSILGTIIISYFDSKFNTLNANGLPSSIMNLFKNPNTVSNTAAMTAIKAKIPAQIMPAFEKLISQVRLLLSNSLHQVFIICIVISVIAFLIVLFMKEIPLSKGSKIAGKAGAEDQKVE